LRQEQGKPLPRTDGYNYIKKEKYRKKERYIEKEKRKMGMAGNQP
jgi:hypothetical protein